MANKRESHHVRFVSSPNVDISALDAVQFDDEKQSIYPPENEDKVSELRPVKRKAHKKSSSLNMDAIANKLNFQKSDEIDEDIKTNISPNLSKYSKKDQEDLISIQSNLRKWIGSEKYLILSQFIDLMDKIAPHVSTQQSTLMFNQMDPSNNGQIPTSLLLHDEFLPRMILNLFQKEDDRRDSITSLPDDFDSDPTESADEDNYDGMDNATFITKIKRFKQESKRLKQWIIEHGQPALEKVDELQMMLDVYEAERSDKQYELQSFKARLSNMGDLQAQLKQTQSAATLLIADNNSLLLSVHESDTQHRIERTKYTEVVREAAEYKKLAKELRDINDKYNDKNESLTEKQSNLEEENQNLRQLVLQYETENTQQFADYHQQIDEYKNEMQSLQKENIQQKVKWFTPEEDDGAIDVEQFRRQRRRRMTLQNEHEDGDTFDENYTLDSELQNSGVIRGRSRRNTIKMWYDVHQRRASRMSLPTEEQLIQEENAMERQDTAQSIYSHQDAHTYKTKENIFEDAVAQEIKIELRKQIEKELSEDYALKLRQKDIELQMKLHREKTVLEEEHRKYREDCDKRIDGLHCQLTEYRKNDAELVCIGENLSFDAEDMRLSSDKSEYSENSDDEKDVFDENMMIDEYGYNYNEVEQPLTGNYKEKKDGFYVESVLQNDEDKKKKRKRKKKKKKSGDESDGCFTCFGLFTGTGV